MNSKSTELVIRKDISKLSLKARTQPMLFFVGSGISIPKPTSLPSARQMINLVVEELAPQHEGKKGDKKISEEKEKICEALPELYYGGLYSLIGQKAVEPWKILNLPNISEQSNLQGKPNIAHMTIVYLSWKNNLPVITTNFDTFFEKAAIELGLKPIVLSRDSIKAKRRNLSSDEVEIWHLHGTIEQPDSICTTLQQISKFNSDIILELKNLFADYPSCLIGYSGRDIDLFPYISNFSFAENNKAYWLCLKFDKNHGIYATPKKFIGFENDVIEFANQIVKHVNDNSLPAKNLLQRFKSDNTSNKKLESSIYLEKGKEIVSEEIKPSFNKINRLLLHGMSLVNIQCFEQAEYYLKRYIKLQSCNSNNARFVAKGWLLLSTVYHNLSKYKCSEQAALKAKNIADRYDLTIEKIHSIASYSEALRMQYCPNLPLSPTLRIKASRVLIIFIIVLFKIKWYRFTSKNIQEDEYIWQVIIEHKIRLLGMIQTGFNQILGESFTSLLFNFIWQQMIKKSSEKGYSAGIANSIKYFSRLKSVSKSYGNTKIKQIVELTLSSKDIYHFMNHRTGAALIERDKAISLLDKGLNDKAAESFQDCIDISKEIGNLSLELKGHLGLYKCGKTTNIERVKQLFEGIQGSGYNELRPIIMDKISESK